MPQTPERLRQQAAILRARGEGSIAAGKSLLEYARQLEETADKEEARRVSSRGVNTSLHKSEESSRVSGMTERERAVKISAGMVADALDPFLAHLRAVRTKAAPHGYTKASLARAVGLEPPSLSACRKPKGDPDARRIRRDRAEKIERLTGWPADAAHWPAGIFD